MADEQKKALRVPVVQVNKPCEECGSAAYPNLEYSVCITGVLCRKCLDKETREIDKILDETKGTAPLNGGRT
jgi:hypothetical protein